MKKFMTVLMTLLCGSVFADPYFVPNIEPYEDYMAMVVVVSLDGTEQMTNTLEIGAFCGEECRGSAIASYFPPTQRYIYQLPVYGYNGDVITFKLFDHVYQTLLDVETDAVQIIDNGYGTLANPYIMDFVTRTFPLAQGWNWWTPTKEASLQDLETALGANGLKIQSETSGACSYADGQWSGTLQSLVPGQMYKIQTNAPCEIAVPGMPLTTVEVSLGAGAHWFGYIGSTSALADVFGVGFGPTTGDKVISQDEGFAIYNGTTWDGTLNTLQPGHGYVYVSKGSTTQTAIFGAPSK